MATREFRESKRKSSDTDVGGLMQSQILSLSKGKIPVRGTIFVDSNGKLAAIVDNDEGLQSQGEFAGEAQYSIKGKTLVGVWVCTDFCESLSLQKEFNPPGARVRGFMNLMTALEDIARLKECEEITLSTWMFYAHPRLMHRLGYKPLNDEEADKHKNLAGIYKGGRPENWDDNSMLVKYVKKVTR